MPLSAHRTSRSPRLSPRRSPSRRLLLVWFGLSVLALGLATGHEPAAEHLGETILSLSDGPSPAGPGDTTPAQAERIEDAIVDAAFRLLPPLEPTDSVATRVLDPPRPIGPHAPVLQTFPPEEPPLPRPAVRTAPRELMVTRNLDGNAPLLSRIELRFSEPMVALAALDTSGGPGIPLTFKPAVPGRWRWLGTRILRFEPRTRLAMATEYRLTFRAGLRSTNGSVLPEDEEFVIRTPTARVETWWPQARSLWHSPVWTVRFNQEVVAESVAAHAYISVRDGRSGSPVIVPVDLVRRESLSVLQRRVIPAAEATRWVALRPRRPIAAGCTGDLVVGRGLPAVEGFLRSGEDQKITFQTFAPLTARVPDLELDGRRQPGQPVAIAFNNPLQSDACESLSALVVPPIEHLVQAWRGNYLYIGGATRGRETYTAVLPTGIADIFGQSLSGGAAFTFRFGTAPPGLSGPGRMIVLDPGSPPVVSFRSRNVRHARVRLYHVVPAAWLDFLDFSGALHDNWKLPERPGDLLVDRRVEIPGAGDAWTETPVDLSPGLGPAGHGQMLLLVEPEVAPNLAIDLRFATWIQATALAIDVLASGDSLWAQVSRLADGTPVAGAGVWFDDEWSVRTTDAAGLAGLPLTREAPSVVVARHGFDAAILPSPGHRHGAWVRELRGPRWELAGFTDRGLYEPGDSLAAGGWLRRLDANGQEITLPEGAIDTLTCTLRDNRGREAARWRWPLSRLGGFGGMIHIPPEMERGGAEIEIVGRDRDGRTEELGAIPLNVQDYRPPEFTLGLACERANVGLGDSVTVTASTHLFTGGGLALARVGWQVRTTPGHSRPEGWHNFHFGAWEPAEIPNQPSLDERCRFVGEHYGLADRAGEHRLVIGIERLAAPVPLNVHVEATVLDANLQSWTETTYFQVHPADIHVGVRSAADATGSSAAVDVIVTDEAGKALAGRPIVVEWSRIERVARAAGPTSGALEDLGYPGWRPRSARPPRPDSLVLVPIGRVERKSDEEPIRIALKADGNPMLSVRVTALDSRNRPIQTGLQLEPRLERRSSGPKAPAGREAAWSIQTRGSATPGDTTTLVIRSRLYPAVGYVRVFAGRASNVTPIALRESMTTVRVRVPRSAASHALLVAHVNGQAALFEEGRWHRDRSVPAELGWEGYLPLERKARELAVSVRPGRAEVSPGDSTSLVVEVRGADGRPVRQAEVMVLVVDEAPLVLAGHRIGDPIGQFEVETDNSQQYPFRPAVYRPTRRQLSAWLDDEVINRFTRLERASSTTKQKIGKEDLESLPVDTYQEAIALKAGVVSQAGELHFRGGRSGEVAYMIDGIRVSDPLAGEGAGYGGAPGSLASMPALPGMLRLRTRLTPLARFVVAATTDAAGRVRVPLRLPDNLTRFRVTVVAAAGADSFGLGESAIRVRLPLMVRPSPPRSLNVGDRFDLPIVVENREDSTRTVVVGIRAANGMFTEGRARRVVVPPGRRVEVPFPAGTTAAGAFHVQALAWTVSGSDAAQFDIPVATPTTVEAVATYGTLDAGGVEYRVAPPMTAMADYGGLSIQASSTVLQELTDAVLYLWRYPYECHEQRTSRLLAMASLHDVLAEFHVPGLPDSAETAAFLAEDISRLQLARGHRGAIGYWPDGRPDPWLGVYVSHAMVHLAGLGLTLPDRAYESSVTYCQQIDDFLPSHYGAELRRSIQAYALYVLALAHRNDDAAVEALAAHPAGLSVEAAAWLLAAGGDRASGVRAGLLRRVRGGITEDASEAHVVQEFRTDDDYLLRSNRRTEAVVLDALLRAEPGDPAIPKLARGLLAARRGGRWVGTQENSWVLLALDTYFRRAEGVVPDFTTRAWLGSAYAGSSAFRGRSTVTTAIVIPMARVLSLAEETLWIDKVGTGRLYYRIGLEYAPPPGPIAADDRGFRVDRTFQAVDDSADVSRATDGTWHVRAGSRVRIDLTVRSPEARHQVALVDHLPGGLEAVNTSFAGTDTDDRIGWECRDWWIDHEILRDHGAEAFAEWFSPGTYHYRYLARATTRGTFMAPPARMEEMYRPEVFGRSTSEVVVVE